MHYARGAPGAVGQVSVGLYLSVFICLYMYLEETTRGDPNNFTVVRFKHGLFNYE